MSQPPGELVPADKVEEILHGLDLPVTGEAEEALAQSPDEYDRGTDRATEEDEEPAEESLSSPEDPVRLYLREIGRIHLLNSEQEVRLGQQIERGQERVRRAIMAVPMVRGQLMDLAEQLRKREVESDQYLEALDGTELTESELRRVQNVFAQIRRLDRELGELEASRNRARKDSTIKAIQEWIAQNHQDRVRAPGRPPAEADRRRPLGGAPPCARPGAGRAPEADRGGAGQDDEERASQARPGDRGRAGAARQAGDRASRETSMRASSRCATRRRP